MPLWHIAHYNSTAKYLSKIAKDFQRSFSDGKRKNIRWRDVNGHLRWRQGTSFHILIINQQQIILLKLQHRIQLTVFKLHTDKKHLQNSSTDKETENKLIKIFYSEANKEIMLSIAAKNQQNL